MSDHGKPTAKKVPGCGWWLPAVTTMHGPKPIPNAEQQDTPYKAKKEAARLMAECGRDKEVEGALVKERDAAILARDTATDCQNDAVSVAVAAIEQADALAEEVGRLKEALGNAWLGFRSIRYHAENGHQDRPLHVRLRLIAAEANAGLEACAKAPALLEAKDTSK